ncbi:protein [Lentinula edodes]|uniref:Protein n=2 Tax=Lentinula edodes TaxID=5353 RepID=A0A1Q3ER75_LENED|nr:protein [Lentinula edodes]
MWTLAQDTPTFDVDDDVFDGSEAVSPKKQVASDALVTAATGRRKNEAAFHCEFPGCEATFTAKHNLHNHLNSHFGIKSFRCPRCLRDFGTPHVLRRHQLICKGKKRFPPPGQPG